MDDRQEVRMGLFSRNSEPLRRTLQRWLRRPIALRTRAWLYLVLVEINLHTPTLLPSDYAPDVHERLIEDRKSVV